MLTFYHGIGHGEVEGCELHINIEGLVHVSPQAGNEAGSIVTGADRRTAEVGDPVVEESEVGSVTGIACMYRLVLHMTESKYLKPLLSGRGHTKSTWTWLKR